jgi:outer membrane protein
MTRCFFFVFILFTFSGRTNAQTRAWTFAQCLDTALERNIQVNQSRLTNELNRVGLEQVKSNRIPNLNANANQGFNIGTNIDPTTNQYVTQTYHSNNFGLTSNLTLFNGLQNSNTIRQYTMNFRAGAYDIEKVRNDVILNITTGYLQVLFAYELVATAKSQAEATQAQVDRTARMVDAGKVPESNLYQIRSQLATDNLTLINAEAQLDMARVTLMQLMEIPVAAGFDVVVPEMVVPSLVLVESNEQVYRKALEVQPEIAGAALKTDAALMEIRISKGARWPRLNLGANLSTNYASSRKQGTSVNPEGYPFFEQVWDNLGQSANLSLAIPIYTNRQIKSNIDRANIGLMSARLNEQNTRNQLRKSVEQTYTDLKSAVKKYEATREQLNAAELSYLNSEKKYNVGLINAIDYLIEKNNYIRAQSNVIQAKYDYIFKSKILDFYQGIPIRFE